MVNLRNYRSYPQPSPDTYSRGFPQNIQHESSLASLRRRHNDAIAEMSEQIDQLNKMKAK